MEASSQPQNYHHWRKFANLNNFDVFVENKTENDAKE